MSFVDPLASALTLAIESDTEDTIGDQLASRWSQANKKERRKIVTELTGAITERAAAESAKNTFHDRVDWTEHSECRRQQRQRV